MRRWLLLVLLTLALPLSAYAIKKPTGKITDPAAFAMIRTYCVDASDLPDYEAVDVEGLVKAESKPKRLLTKVPWTLVANCTQSQPDAIIKVTFRRLRRMNVRLGQPPAPGEIESAAPYAIRAVLQVSDASSSQLLYETDAAPLSNSMTGESVVAEEEPDHLLRRNAAYNAFWTLVQDLRRASRKHQE